MKNALAFLLIACSLAFSACGDSKKKSSSAKPEVKTGVAPVADPEIAVIEMENGGAYGTIKVELYSNIAPKMVERFKTLAQQGFYNGTTFHRINESVIQGGDPNSKDSDPMNDGMGGSQLPNVPAEFSDVPYERGILGAARAQDFNSANCQFFITMKRVQQWDKTYTVFGKVIEGMNNAQTIQGAPTDKDGGNPERPIDEIRIKSITIVKR